MPRFERDGVVLAYDDTGVHGRTPLVFLHGLSSARSTWARFVPAFDTEHRVLTLDHRGHGESAHAPGTYTLDHYGPDAVDFCERVVGEPAVLIGHSLGGVVAHAVAWSRPDLVRGVLLEDPPLYVGERDPADNSFTTIFALMRQVIIDLQSQSAPLEEYEAMMATARSPTSSGKRAPGPRPAPWPASTHRSSRPPSTEQDSPARRPRHRSPVRSGSYGPIPRSARRSVLNMKHASGRRTRMQS
jgi:pimeloyl-ACP methyl ester carboxylesterase